MQGFILKSKEIAVEVSSYCGANCIMCPHDSFELRNRNMPFSLFKKIVDEAVMYGAISLDICLLGDALLAHDAEEKLAYCREAHPSLKVYCSTTAQTATPAFVSKYIDSVQISLYGNTKQTYESVHRGGLVFENTIANVEGILDLPKEKRPYVQMTFLCLPQNEHEMEDWKQRWEPRADEIMIWKPHNWAGVLYDNHYSEQQYKNAKSCGRPFTGDLCIWVNGDVSVCCFSADKRLVVGNSHEHTLEEIDGSERMKQIRAIHKNAAFFRSNLPCEKCDQIFPRDGALIYSSKGRTVGTKISQENHVYKFEVTD